jgi:hypothetical protein
MMHKIQQIRVLGAVVLVAGFGHAQTKAPPVSSAPACLYLYRGDIDSRYAFAEATEVALWYAALAAHESDEFEGKNTWDISDWVSLMRAAKAKSEAYRCAELILQPFERSSFEDRYVGGDDKKIIALGARFGTQIYRHQITLMDQSLNMLREMETRADNIRNNVGGAASRTPPGWDDRVSTLQVEVDKFPANLVLLAGLSISALFDASYSDAEGHGSGTILKRSEKEEFLNRVVRDFPEIKDNSQSGKWAGPSQVASLYLKYLRDAWVCTDERQQH